MPGVGDVLPARVGRFPRRLGWSRSGGVRHELAADTRRSLADLRANQVWAPYPDNDPEAARRLMTRFYQLLRKSTGDSFDPVKAARLEVEWWRVHREAQHAQGSGPSEALTAALRDLYAYAYSVDPAEVQGAAALRAEAMDVSDRWVESGCDPEDPQLSHERGLLVRSYAGLLAAVHR